MDGVAKTCRFPIYGEINERSAIYAYAISLWHHNQQSQIEQ